MKKNQNNLLTTGQSVLATLDTLTAANVPPALVATRTALRDLLGEINGLVDQQATPLAAKTSERNEMLAATARAAHVIARLVRGHALATGQLGLAAEVSFSASDLLVGRLNRRVQYMRQIHAAAAPLAAELVPVGVTPEMLADFTAGITRAEAGLPLPRSNIATRRVATKNLVEAFAKLNRMLRFTLDPLMETLRATDPDSYTRYVTARRVIDRPGTPADDDDASPSAKPAAAPSALASQPLAA